MRNWFEFIGGWLAILSFPVGLVMASEGIGVGVWLMVCGMPIGFVVFVIGRTLPGVTD